jgi:hypothetical protein
MKVTKTQLKQIIKEEYQRIMSEAAEPPVDPPSAYPEPRRIRSSSPDLPKNPRLDEPTFSVYSFMTTQQLEQLKNRIQSETSQEAMAEKAQIEDELAKREEANKPIKSTK